MKYMFFLFIIAALFFTSCKKDEPKPQELPPATQTGERAFGAYVNGEVWVPKGRPSAFVPNFELVYDPYYRGGNLEITAYRVSDTFRESIYIYMSNLDQEGVYHLGNPEIGTAFFYSSNCNYLRDDEVYQDGILKITRLDMDAGIVSGQFEFTLTKPDCDTIKVREGRFDYKL